MSAVPPVMSAVFLQGEEYERKLNVLLSPIDDAFGRDVKSLAGSLEFSNDDIQYLSEKRYPFVYMLDQWIKRKGAENASLKLLHEALIELKRPDAAQIIDEAIDHLKKQDPEILNETALLYNRKLRRTLSNFSLCPSFPSESTATANEVATTVEYPLMNSQNDKTDKTKVTTKEVKHSAQDKNDVPNAYVVYATEDLTLKENIRKFVQKLRKKGINATAEMFEENESASDPGYHIYSKLIKAEYVLLICTSAFGVETNEDSGEGRKAAFILKLVLDFLYHNAPYNTKYIPVLLNGCNKSDIPFVLRGNMSYNMTTREGYDDLIRRLFKIEKYKLVDLPEKRPQLMPIQIGNMIRFKPELK